MPSDRPPEPFLPGDVLRRAYPLANPHLMKNPKEELRELSINLEGMADGIDLTEKRGSPISLRLRRCAEWLLKLSPHVCRHGIIGCRGGDTCTSDHK